MAAPRPYSFTRTRLSAVVQEAYQHDPDDASGLSEDFQWQDEALCKSLKSYCALTLKQNAQPNINSEKRSRICSMLQQALEEGESHLERLDSALSLLLQFRISYLDSTVEEIVERASAVLERLEAEYEEYHEPDDKATCSNLASDFFCQDHSEARPQTLCVSKFYPTILLQLAVLVSMPIRTRLSWKGQASLLLVNMIARQLEHSLQPHTTEHRDTAQLLVLRSCLWTMWHRALALHRWYVLRMHLEYGFTYNAHDTLQLHGDRIEAFVRKKGSCHQPSSTEMFPNFPRYLCKWAFTMLRLSPSLIGADYRALVDRLGQVYPRHQSRCVQSMAGSRVYEQCDGETPAGCQRLRNPTFEFRDVHTDHCSGQCHTCVFDETSFSQKAGVPALSIDMSRSGRLEYCQASNRTMVISHGYSSAVGDLMNEMTLTMCQHRRLCALARRSGCDSYWIASACIPRDSGKRSDILVRVNAAIEGSKLVLIWDPGLVGLDAPDVGLMDVRRCEQILSVLLISDWNSRVWPLLEAAKGPNDLHILCKNDAVISAQQILHTVHTHGSIDLANSFLSVYHLLKPNEAWVLANFSPEGYIWRNEPRDGTFVLASNTRLMALEEASILLCSRRAASESEAILVWSMLLGMLPTGDIENFWINVNTVRTGYLISSMPRLSGLIKFSWAPSQIGSCIGRLPCPLTNMVQWIRSASNSDQGKVIQRQPVEEHLGYKAVWEFCDLGHLDASQGLQTILGHGWQLLVKQVTRKRSERTLEPWNTITLPTSGSEWQKPYEVAMHGHKVRSSWLLMTLPTDTRKKLYHIVQQYPKDIGHIALIHPSHRESDDDDQLQPIHCSLGVIASVNGDEFGARWRWIDVVDWDMSIELPLFKTRGLLIV